MPRIYDREICVRMSQTVSHRILFQSAFVTFPLDQGRVDLESSGWVLVLSGSAETARVSSADAVVFIRNSCGERYPSAEWGRSVL